MSRHPKIRTSRLREIGWSLWDPIGLANYGSGWEAEGYADEYDSYLLQAVGMVRNREPFAEIVDYLIEVETDRMGLSPHPDMRPKAEAVVRAMQDDDELWSEPS